MPNFDSNNIPNFLQNSQMYSYAENEINYKKEILYDINYLIGNFNFNSNSYYILSLFAQWFRIPIMANATVPFLQQQIQSVVKALQTAGSFESFLALFKAFLGVNINITVGSGQPGQIVIQLLEYPQFNQYTVVLGSGGSTGFLTQNPDSSFSTLAIGKSENDYIDNFYLFIKSLIPVGRTLVILEPPA